MLRLAFLQQHYGRAGRGHCKCLRLTFLQQHYGRAGRGYGCRFHHNLWYGTIVNGERVGYTHSLFFRTSMMNQLLKTLFISRGPMLLLSLLNLFSIFFISNVDPFRFFLFRFPPPPLCFVLFGFVDICSVSRRFKCVSCL